MRNQRLDDLFFRYCEKNMTAAEHEELMALLLLDENRGQINSLIDQLIREDNTEDQMLAETADDILSSIFSATSSQPIGATEIKPDEFLEPKALVRSLWLTRLAAASVTLLLIYGGYRWYQKAEPQERQVSVMQSVYGEDVAAGGNKAKLTLANGKTIDLATITNAGLEGEEGIVINRSIGEISYNQSSGKRTEVAYNTLKTPLGGQYKVVLPDGSRAWLNAGSMLKYPVAFIGNERNVEMSGEVYFEVEPNKKMPFRVTVTDRRKGQKDAEITVLGTHFNVSSYGDEPVMQTTLLEGSVQVKKGNAAKILKPGQQAMVPACAEGCNIPVKMVDTESVVAWKEGRFEFNGSIMEIMRQISRWYDIDVTYEGNVEKKSFVGTISRKNNVSEVLKMLEMTGGIQFRINERKITVRSNE